MVVVRTDKWLLDSYSNPVKICEHLEKYFDDASSEEIYRYLTLHGMYRPYRNGAEIVSKLSNKNIWKIVDKEFKHLQKIWKGPDIPVFIFPSENRNRRMKQDFNGKSGVSFKDKLFLFLSEENDVKEIQALLTHEYNHTCRLTKYHKKEKDYTLLDSIILEGLAENAVRERLGEGPVAAWTSYYSDEELEKFWNTLFLPKIDIKKNHHKYHDLLYGLRFYPKMVGYAVGHYLVRKFIETSGLSVQELMNLETEKIAGIDNSK